MNWDISYTKDARQDLQNIFDYIHDILLEPVTAEKLTNSIMDAVDSLDQFPFRHRLYAKEPWHSQGLRVLPVGNYLIFYLPVEAENVVTIVRIMYGGRDVETRLDEKPE